MSRGNQKHERDAVRVAEAMHPGLKARIEGRRRHSWLVATLGPHTIKVSLSCSPADPRECINHTRQHLRRALKERGLVE